MEKEEKKALLSSVDELEKINENSESPEFYSSIDEILNKVGYGKEQWKMILAAFLVKLTSSYNLFLFDYLLVYLKNYYPLTYTEITIISSLVFLGVAISNFISGYLTKIFDKRTIVIASLISAVIINFIITFAFNNKYIFAVCRILAGIPVGLCLPLVMNNLSEVLPIHFRSFTMMMACSGIAIGQLLINLVMLIVIPNTPKLTERMLFDLFGMGTIVPLLCSVVCIYFFYNAPRGSLVRGENDECFLVLEEMIDRKLNQYEKESIVEKFKISNTNVTFGFCEVFSPYLKSTSILLIFIWFFNCIVYYGSPSIVGLTIKGLNLDTKYNVQQIQTFMTMLVFFGYVIGGALSETKILGRTKSILMAYFLFIIFVTAFLFKPTTFKTTFGLAYAISPMFSQLTPIYTSEVYPSVVRDLALGLMLSIGKSSGFLSKYILIYMNEGNVFLPFYFMIATCTISFVLVVLLPYETQGKPLDYDQNANKKENEIKEDSKQLC
jgi:MFS transporter, AAHS family, 4-hydroxybenzoate transporter